MGVCLFNSDPVCWSLDEHVSHQIDALLAVLLFHLYCDWNILLQDVIQDLLTGAPLEGRGLSHHHKHDDPSRPHVAPLVVLLQKHLRSDIVGCADSSFQGLAVSSRHRNAKVNQFQPATVLIEEHVFRFDIAVYNPLSLEVE